MTGQLDLDSVEVLGVTQCDLDVPDAGSTEWPCPACGDHRPLRRSWAMKVRNRVGPPMERAVVVCEQCFTRVGERLATEIPTDPLTIRSGDDPLELLRQTFDTDEVEVPFRL